MMYKKIIFIFSAFIFIFSLFLFIPKSVNAGAGGCQSSCAGECTDGPYGQPCAGGYTYCSCQCADKYIAQCGDRCFLSSGCHNTGSSCFPAGTKVTLPNKSTKNIEQVKPGDQVLSENPDTGKQSVSNVVKVQTPISNNLCQINLTNGDSLQVTKGHPLYTQNGWMAIDPKETAIEDPGVPVNTLSVGNLMKKDTGQWVQISDISCQNIAVQTYNLTVDSNSDFFADDYLAHNKGCKCGGGWDPWGCSKGCPNSCQHGSFCGYSKIPPIQKKYDCRCYHCDPCPTCSVTAPTGATITRINATSATINWTPATTNTTSQIIEMDTDKAAVNGNCPSGCDIFASELDPALSTYTVYGLKPGTVYYWRVVTFHDQYAGCKAGTPISTYISSCNITSSAGNTLSIGDSTTITSNVLSNAIITNVSFSSSNSDIMALNPTTDTTYPYSTKGTTAGSGNITITSNVNSASGILCTATLPMQVLAKEAWWQVRNADVMTNGDLVSPVVFGNFFGLAGAGGYPGVPVYGGALGGIDSTNVSETSQKWIANATAASPKTFDYQFFANQIPSDVTMNTIVNGTNITNRLTDNNETADSEGYYWFKYDGGATGLPAILNATDIGTRKVILFVQNADVNITGNITLTSGQGFFILITDGNLNVDPSVGGGATPNIEGFYVMDGDFDDGTYNPGETDPATNPDTELSVRGSVIVNGSATLERDLGPTGNTTTPGELFTFAPEQMMLFPKALSVHPINWKEIAP